MRRFAPDRATDNLVRWERGVGPHYEVWFLTLAASGRSWWIRYTLSAAPDGGGRASLWFSHFDRDRPADNRSRRQDFPVDQVSFTDDPFRLNLGGATLCEDRAAGRLTGRDGVSVSWDLSWHPNHTSLYHLPLPLYRHGPLKTRVLSPNQDVTMNGYVEIGGRRHDVTGAGGEQSHIWGTRHAERWAWGHCNRFEEGEGSLEVLAAQVRVGRVLVPVLTLMWYWVDDDERRRVGCNGLLSLVTNRSDFTLGEFCFRGRSLAGSIRGRLRCRTEDLLGVPYRDPDGSPLLCYNSEVGDLDAVVTGAFHPPRKLRARGSAALEFAGRWPEPPLPVQDLEGS